jgi:hypothetical protein
MSEALDREVSWPARGYGTRTGRLYLAAFPMLCWGAYADAPHTTALPLAPARGRRTTRARSKPRAGILRLMRSPRVGRAACASLAKELPGQAAGVTLVGPRPGGPTADLDRWTGWPNGTMSSGWRPLRLCITATDRLSGGQGPGFAVPGTDWPCPQSLGGCSFVCCYARPTLACVDGRLSGDPIVLSSPAEPASSRRRAALGIA